MSRLVSARATSAAVALLTMVACGSSEVPQPQPSVAVVSLLQPIATVQELMAADVDPSADAVWDSVSTTISRAGTEEKQPRTPAEWAAARRDMLHLTEAANLLLIEGRRVASKPFAAEAQGALDSAQIEQRISADRSAFDGFAVALRATGVEALAAIDKHDPQALLRVGGTLDGVCEACHLSFWYPNQVIPPLPPQSPAPHHAAPG